MSATSGKELLIDPPTEQDWQKVLQEFNTTKQRVTEDVALLKQWYREQPHLPQCVDGFIFQAFLIRCGLSIERTKHAIDSYFTLKTALPEFYTNRDPMCEDIKSTFDIVELYVMQSPIDGCRITVCNLIDPDPAKFSPDTIARLTCMVVELFHTKYEIIDVSEIIIIDCKNGTIGHVAQASLLQLRKYEQIHSKGFQLPIKAIHFVNSPTVMALAMALLKTVLPSSLMASIHVHQNFETLYEHVDRDLLPQEYGGKQKSLQKMAAVWRREVESHRDWYLKRELLEKVDESKRPGKSVNSIKLFGMEGSFRKLTVD